MRLPRLTYANVVSSLALFIALGGTSYAVIKLPRNSVGSTQVRDRSLKAVDLSRDVTLGGSRGPQGAPGAAGLKGDPGVAGERGPAGPGEPEEPEAWIPLPYVGGWANYGEVWGPAGYRKEQSGRVHLRGLATKNSGAPAKTDIIAVLPAGYRPAAPVMAVVATGGSPIAGTLEVFPTGEIRWIAGSNVEQDYTSLFDVSFSTD